MLFKSEFEEIVRDFKNGLPKEYQLKSYSFLGSPLMKSDYLIIGNNWGGPETEPSQNEMPNRSDILDPQNQGSTTYRGYKSFFLTLFENDESKLVSFLERAVYTNACFIRTPNTDAEYREILNYGYRYSYVFLKRIISLVDPQLIVCFGNGNNPTSTSTISRMLGMSEKYWTDKNTEQIPLANKTNSYIMRGKIGIKSIEVFSFPHASKYDIWSSSLETRKSFIVLKGKIT